MDVAKWSTQIVLAASAVGIGWIAKDAFGGVESSSAEPPEPVESAESDDELAEALSALAARSDGAARPVALTIVLGEGDAAATAAGQGGPSPGGRDMAASPAPSPGDRAGQGLTRFPATGGARAGPSGGASADSRPSGGASTGSGPSSGASAGAGLPQPGHTAPAPAPVAAWRRASRPPGAPANPASLASPGAVAAPVGGPGGGGIELHLSPETGTVAVGEHIVIAYDDSIVLVGDNGRLTGNTGDAGQGGIVALDAQGSAFRTASGTSSGAAARPGTAGTLTTAGPGSAPPAGSTTVAADGALAAFGSGTGGASPGAVSPLVSPIVLFTEGRAVDIAGYEDHSLSIRGERNLVTYDDSNVFIDRNGQINANTGDLDSAGLNAVDTVRSTVTSGDHCDDGCDDESIIQAQAGVFDEGDVALDANGNPVWAPGSGAGDEAGAGNGAGAGAGDDSLPGDDGDDEDAGDDESEDGDVSDPVEPAETRQEADSGAEPAQRPPGDSLVIGGDGYDDLGIRVDGADNIATYDDSNVVLGGTGDVNAQIGDADTGGVAAMGTVDSTVTGGNSR